MKSYGWGVGVLVFAALLFSPIAGADTFSVGTDTWGGDSDVAFRSGIVNYDHASIGLQATDDVNGLSAGDDPLPSDIIIFSVDIGTQGNPGTAVRARYDNQSATHGAADDVFITRPESTLVQERSHQDNTSSSINDLDAYDLTTLHTGNRIYFTIASGGSTADDVIYTSIIGSGTYSVYANAATLGLQAGDDIDAVSIYDVNRDGTYNPGGGDLIRFSLTTNSPSYVTYFQIYAPGAGSPSALVSHSSLGLRNNIADDLNALEHSPEPSSMALMGLGLLGLGIARRRRKK